MIETVKKTWRELKSAPAGVRFRQCYSQRNRLPCGICRKLLRVGQGTGVIAVGIVMIPAPGPGTIVVLAGIALLARESLYLARAMDWLEMKLRRVFGRSPINAPRIADSNAPDRSAAPREVLRGTSIEHP